MLGPAVVSVLQLGVGLAVEPAGEAAEVGPSAVKLGVAVRIGLRGVSGGIDRHKGKSSLVRPFPG